jgi:predicted 3-demethylubiquinone-9 3-methyltransferase (glyoxalase superfamily)
VFTFNPSVSFFVYCGSDREIERIYSGLMKGGTPLMPLDKYQWSEKYAWIRDKYGLTWQLDVDKINSDQKVLPSLLFVNEKMTRVREAMQHYCGVFPNSKVLLEAPYDNSVQVPEGTLLFAQYKLNGYLLNSMSSTLKHDYDFNEAVSLIVYCDTQDEIDHYWKQLTKGGQEQQCGWLKDKFGLVWQIVPRAMNEMMLAKDKEQLARVTQAMLQMIKLDLKKLEQAFHNG